MVFRTFALRDDAHLPRAQLPASSALTSMEIQLYSVQPSDRPADLLTAIDSAPALSSVTFGLFVDLAVVQSDIDKWLARLAGERNKAGAGLVVMLGP